uniref:Uncharacterized protein n=1 Tax=Rousettus aegyptiacus TaxID=9407 RepID=A0A7J8D6V4_ROUAE|nr:hypothetical protein HJG63_008847 [Rousettus aegyptiacus]
MFYLTELLRYEYVSSQSLHAQCDDAKRYSLWEVIGHESGGFHEWDQCSSKRDLTELPSPFYLVRTQQEVRSLPPRKRPSPNPDLRLLACKLCCLQATPSSEGLKEKPSLQLQNLEAGKKWKPCKSLEKNEETVESDWEQCYKGPGCLSLTNIGKKVLNLLALGMLPNLSTSVSEGSIPK